MTRVMQKSVSYLVSEQELIAAYRRQHQRSWKSPRALGQSALLFAVAWLVAIGANISHSGYDGAIGGATKFVGMILALMPVMYLLGYWLWGDYVKKQFRERPAMREGYDLNWSEDGFNLRSESTDSFMRWTSLLSWLQDDLGFQIYVAKNSFFWLPRRAFSAEQWDDLRETLVRSGLSGNGNEQTASSPLRRRKSTLLKGRGGLWSRSSGVALLWTMLVLVSVTHFLFFPASWRGGVGNLFFVSTIPLILGILGAAILRLRASAFTLTSALLAVAIAFATIAFAWSFFRPPTSADASGSPFRIEPTLIVALILWFRYPSRTWLRRGAAILALTGASIALSSAVQSEGYLWHGSAQVRSWLQLKSPYDDAENSDPMDGIMADQLWGAQPSLILDAAKNFRPRVSGASNIYAMAVAADGTQQIFSREGRAALKFAEERFGKSYRGGMLLSNGTTNLMQTPLATLGNLSVAMDQFSARADPDTDIAFIYLTSHGSEDAELSTGLPNYAQLTLFSANAVADLLARTGIRRRIIIVSACYSGSWIPALANDDTIIVTASSKDRTSFGCDDRRNLTLFGENFLQGQSVRGGSLHDAFEAAQANIARQEAAWKIIPSKPQAYVGKNMKETWTRQFSK
jgi:hypothetical protein